MNATPPNPKDEPVVYAGIVLAIANVIAQFAAKHGIALDAASVAAFLTSALTIGTAFFVRSKVHANPKVEMMVAAARAEGPAPVTHITIPPKGAA